MDCRTNLKAMSPLLKATLPATALALGLAAAPPAQAKDTRSAEQILQDLEGRAAEPPHKPHGGTATAAKKTVIRHRRSAPQPKPAAHAHAKPAEHFAIVHYSVPCPPTEQEGTICESDQPELADLSEQACADIDGTLTPKGGCRSKNTCEELDGQSDDVGVCFIPLPAKQAGEAFKDCEDCPTMVVVPAGRFAMGSPDTEAGRDPDEGPRHEVAIVRPFAIAKQEVTRQAYAQFISASSIDTPRECLAYDGQPLPGSNWHNPGFVQADTEPVVCVTWDDAQAYARWLSAKTGKHYRLPSEAEWEYAARAGSEASRFWGDNPDQACSYANVADADAQALLAGSPMHGCADGAPYTAPGGKYLPNKFGLHDMLGNVWEWTQDCYHPDYGGAPVDGAAWEAEAGAECPLRVIRGGSSGRAGKPDLVRSASRWALQPGQAYSMAGFRLAVDLEP